MDMLFDWPEIIALFFLIFGFMFAVFSASLLTACIVCFLMGLIFGRVWYKRLKKGNIPVFLTIMTFLIGFIVGNAFRQTRLVVVFFFVGIFAGYWVSKKKFLKIR